MSAKTTCAEIIHSGWDRHHCSRTASVDEGGKWWCKQHSPSAKQARRNARDANWNAERERNQLEWKIKEAEEAIVKCALGSEPNILPPFLGALVDDLRRLKSPAGQQKDSAP